MASTRSPDTVHILWLGRPYCGLPGVPGEWPDGHLWVDKDSRRDANCPGCLERACSACGSFIDDQGVCDTPHGSDAT